MTYALDGIRVLEIGTFVSAPYCGKLFAGYGAEVIKIEPPGGDISRAHGPFRDDTPNAETSALFMYLNTGKRSVDMDLRTPQGLEAFCRLVEQSDVVVENFRPIDLQSLGITYSKLREINPRVVLVSITAYGQDGPYRNYRANNLTAFAMGGQMFITGTQEGGPLKTAGYQADYQGGLNGFSAAMLALMGAERDGEGQHVDVSVQHCMAPILEAGIPYYSYLGRWAAERRGNHMASFIGIYPCTDGHLGIHIMPRNWKPFCEAVHRMDLFDDPRFRTQADRAVHNDDLMAEFYAWAATETKKEIYERAGRMRAPIAYVHTMADLLESPHLRERGFIQQIHHPVAGEASYPGPPWWIGPDGWRSEPAPLLGADTEEVLSTLARLSPEAIKQLRSESALTV